MPNSNHDIPFRYVTVKELETVTNKSRSSIYRDVAKGALPPPIKIGGSVRWRSDQLVEFFDSMGV